MSDGKPHTPWHLWVIGIVTLFWNGMGANDYVQTQMGNMEYMQSGAEMAGVPVQVIVDYYTAFPVWANALWALGVWGAVAGSLLLLLRSRFAFHAYIVAVIGLAGTTIYTFTHAMPEELNSPFQLVFSSLIWAVLLLCIWYAWRMTARGILR